MSKTEPKPYHDDAMRRFLVAVIETGKLTDLGDLPAQAEEYLTVMMANDELRAENDRREQEANEPIEGGNTL
jgi:hypothetical protein